jgi:dTDP-4-dehydrorhamnose reductase
MKILLTGKNGQVGFELQRSLAVLGEVRAIDLAECDLSDEVAIRREVQAFQPDVVVNPAAYTAVDQAESQLDLADAVNARAPSVFAEEAQRLGALMLHFSTDYVYDGTKPTAYVESDAPAPRSVYGRTKLAGDEAVQAQCKRHLILRTSWVVGAHGGNFAKTMLRLAAEREALNVVADQFGAPTSAALLADVAAHLIRQTATVQDGPWGVYHATASGETNWHEYACWVIEAARTAGRPIRVPPGGVRAISSAEYPTPAQRPANSRLNTAKLQATFGLRLPPWQEGLGHILQQIL